MRAKKKNRYARLFLWIISIILFNLVSLILLLNIPAVQTRLAQSLSRMLSEKIGFVITVKEVDIEWIDRLSLKGLKVLDDNGDDFVHIESLELNYKLAKIFKETINLDRAEVSGLQLELKKVEGDTLNITTLINRLKKLAKPKNPKSGKIIGVDEVFISNSKFKYDLGSDDKPTNYFNPQHFSLIDLNAHLKSLVIVSDTFMVDILSLSTEEEHIGAKVNQLEAQFLISPRLMRFDSLNLQLGKSEITRNILFSYNGYDALQHFTDSVQVKANISNSKIYSTDLSYFIPYFKKVNDKYLVSASIDGEISNVKVKKLHLRLGRGSNITGSVYLSGLPHIDETFMDISLRNSTIIENDIEQYIGSSTFSKYNRFSKIKVNGSFTGYTSDFVTSGEIQTNLGTLITDINLKLANNTAQTSYSGKIQLIGFELGNYLEQDRLGRITLSGKIEGKGLRQANANFKFDGAIDSLAIYDYTYSNIQTKGKFQEEYFSGLLTVDDPNLKLTSDANIDLRAGRNNIYINGELEYARLDALKLVDGHTLIKSKIEADFKGFVLDSIIGHIYLEEFYAEHNDQTLSIEHLTLNSEKDNEQRSLEFITARANVKVTGNFNFTPAIKDLRKMGMEYILSLQNNSDTLRRFYENESNYSTKPYSINVKARFNDIDRFFNLFEPKLSFHKKTEIDIIYNHGSSGRFFLQIDNDTISYDGNTFIGNKLNIDASKVLGKPEILASVDVQSQAQILNNGARLDDLIVSAIWNNKEIDFNWHHTQKNIDNVNDLFGVVHFYEDSTKIHFSKSNLSLLNNSWTIQEDNSIRLANQEVKISNLNIFSSDQILKISGMVSKDPEKSLSITAENLDVGLINPMISKELSGRISGEFTITNMLATPTIVSNFYISSFAIDQFPVGDIFSSNDWNNELKLFDIQFLVNRDGTPMIMVNGVFNPFDRENALNLNATFRNARLTMAEPFIETLFSEIEGGITGNIHIIGPVRSPTISGHGSFQEASLRVNYLNTTYDVDGEWAFDSTAIILNNLLLTDKNNNKATLDGEFNHKDFRNFNVNLIGNMEKFLVLNTTAIDNDLFYGTGIASGRVAFTGPLENITINAQAKTEKGTKFFIPIGGSSSSQVEDYISFVSFSDTLNNVKIDQDEKVKIRGLNLEFDLEITDEAYTEIIFDITSGDIIRGRGNGNLSLNVDTKGEFTMIGNYEFVQGGYNFTMYNIVNKEFTINPKSTITWSGDPYGGIMNIDAAYRLSTSLEPIVDESIKDNPDVKRIYPTEVLLSLDGPFLAPDIGFEIIIDEYPKSNADLDTQVKGFLNTISLDQQELNRQVFSLLILRKFSAPNSFSSSGSVGSSVSEFVANQLSYWISQVDENLTIDMDLGELDEDALRTFQLRVSYAFMEGKLIITRDGGFTDPNSNEASVGSIAGDWTLEYLLTEDGKLRVKLFNKTNYNQLNSSTGSDSQSLLTGGFSLIYTISFNKFGELFENKKKDDKEKEVNTEPTTLGIKPKEYQHEEP